MENEIDVAAPLQKAWKAYQCLLYGKGEQCTLSYEVCAKKISCVLVQKGEEGRESDISYWYRALN